MRSKSVTGSEHQHQATVIAWARANKGKHACLRWLYAIPNAAKRSIRLASSMKAEGLTAGILDLCLPAGRLGYCGLYIEMKIGDKKPTKEQFEFMDYLQDENYFRKVCYSCDEAIETLKWYLGEK